MYLYVIVIIVPVFHLTKAKSIHKVTYIPESTGVPVCSDIFLVIRCRMLSPLKCIDGLILGDTHCTYSDSRSRLFLSLLCMSCRNSPAAT